MAGRGNAVSTWAPEAWEMRILSATLERRLCSVDDDAWPHGPSALEEVATQIERGDIEVALASAAKAAGVREPSPEDWREQARGARGPKERTALAACCMCLSARVNLVGPPSDRDAGSAKDAAALSRDGEDVDDAPVCPELLLACLELVAPDASYSASQEALDSRKSPLPHPPSAAWWALRALATQQRSLKRPSGRVWAQLAECCSSLLAHLPGGLREMVLIEAAGAEMSAENATEAKRLLSTAAQSLGIDPQLTGVMGFRSTVQKEATPQLVAQASSHASPSRAGGGAGGDDDDDDDGELGNGEDIPVGIEMREKSSLELRREDQAVLLCMAELTRVCEAMDELRPWEERAWAEAVLCQARSRPALKACAKVIVARAELGHPKSCERGLARMEGVVEALSSSSCSPRSRLRWAFSVPLPARAAVRRELGECYSAAGMHDRAAEVFESLGQWERLVGCYRALGKREQAEHLLESLLQEVGEEPRLLCALGESRQDESLLIRAWEKSNESHARSKRCLALAAERRNDFSAASRHWEDALSLNSLHSQDWFHLGHCLLKLGHWSRAHDAFTRSGQLTSEAGEAWNNAAAAALQLGGAKDGAAVEALREAVRQMPGDWRAHENLALAALRIGKLQTAANALKDSHTASSEGRLDPSIASQLVERIERARSQLSSPASSDGQGREEKTSISLSESLSALAESGIEDDPDDGEEVQDGRHMREALEVTSLREVERAQETLRSALEAAARSSAGGEAIWGCLARLREFQGDSAGAKECLVKQARRLEGSKWQRDEDAFRKYASVCEKLCRLHEELGELNRARLLAGSVLSGSSKFDTLQEYARLQAIHSRVEEQHGGSSSCHHE